MKCNVIFINEANLTSIDDKRSKTKQLRYELTRNTDLPIHIQNIHKSLSIIGYKFNDPPSSFTLRITPVIQPDSTIFPVYLQDSGPDIDSQLIQLLDCLTKQQRKKGFLIEFVLTPEVRAKRLMEILSNKSNTTPKIKDTAFKLISQIKDKKFAKAFEVHGGIKVLLDLLDSAKGNTIAYTVNAIGACLQGNPDSLKVLLENDGVVKLFKNIDCSVLSIVRRTIEVLHHICHMEGTIDIFYEAANLNENKGFLSIFKQLESVDLHTRLSALRIVNKLLDSSTVEKTNLLNLIKENHVPFSLQKSLSITIPEIAKGLHQFEVVSGIVLSQVTSGGKDLKEKVKKLEEEVKLLQAEKNIDQPVGVSLDTLDSLENEIGELCFDSIDFSADLLSSSNIVDIMESSEDSIASNPEIKTIVTHSNLNIQRKGSLPQSDQIHLKLELDKTKEELIKAQKELKDLKHDSLSNIKYSTSNESDNESNDNDNDNNHNNDNSNITTLQEEIDKLTKDNDDYHAKILKLSDTIQCLIKEGNPTLACEHCVNEPGKIFHLSTEDQVRASTVIVPLSSKSGNSGHMIPPTAQIQGAFNTIQKTEELEQNLKILEEQLETLQQEKCTIELDKYQLNIELDFLKNENKAIKIKKQKLAQVIQNLQTKRISLLEQCESSKNTLNSLKENITSIQDENKSKDIELLKDLSNSELIEKIKELYKVVHVLNMDKNELTSKITQLETNIDN